MENEPSAKEQVQPVSFWELKLYMLLGLYSYGRPTTYTKLLDSLPKECTITFGENAFANPWYEARDHEMGDGFIESELGFLGYAEYQGFHEGWLITEKGKEMVQLGLIEHDRDPDHLKHIPAIKQFFEEHQRES